MRKDPFRYTVKEGKTYIWDAYRRKYVFLSPEEWVRQNILYFLVKEKKYPRASISVEKQIKVGTTFKRYDAVVYYNNLPWLLLECKEEEHSLQDVVLQQILAYQTALKVAFLSITNGKKAFTYSVGEQQWMEGFPEYPQG
jgi:type I site-specific restriction-modification system R (restriction) subunit